LAPDKLEAKSRECLQIELALRVLMVADTNIGFGWTNEANRVGAIFGKGFCDGVIYRLRSEWGEVEGPYYTDRASRIHLSMVARSIVGRQCKENIGSENILCSMARVAGKECRY
jgi:hypothetical protein